MFFDVSSFICKNVLINFMVAINLALCIMFMYRYGEEVQCSEDRP